MRSPIKLLPRRIGAFSARLAPFNLALPAITGDLTQGQTLTASTGTWSGAPTSYAYQWYSAGSAIGGATSSTYATQVSDLGNLITVRVTATNAAGATAATSAAAGPIARGSRT